MSVKKIIGTLHLWLGLSSGLIVFILGVTGCIYAFIEEIQPIVYKEWFHVKPESSGKKPLTEIWKAAQDTIGDQYCLSGVNYPNTADESCRLTIYKPSEKPGIWVWEASEFYKTIYVNPYTAKVIKVEDRRFEFFEIIVNLHWSLLLVNEIGQPIVGIATLIFVVLLISGLVLWWPKNKSAAKQRFWFRWKNTTQWKRKNYDLHNIPGFYSFLVALLFGLTGLVWTFDWFDESVQWIANGGITHEHPAGPVSDTTQISSLYPIDTLFNQVLKQYPEAKAYSIYVSEETKGTISVFVRNKGRFDYVANQYDKYSGKLLETETFDQENNGHKLRGMNYDIHTGGILGLPGKILAFIGSLICASLPVTGLYIWWGRRNKSKKGNKKSSLASNKKQTTVVRR